MTAPQETPSLKAKDLPDWAKDASNLPVKFEPPEDRVVMFPDPERDVSESGVTYSKNTRNEIELVGTVVAVGPGKISEFTGQLIPMFVKPGERYIFQKYAGDDYLLDAEGRIRPYTGRVPSTCILVKVVRQSSLTLRILA